MLEFITILSILAMGFCVLCVFSAILAGTYLKVRKRGRRGSRRF